MLDLIRHPEALKLLDSDFHQNDMQWDFLLLMKF